MKLRVFTICLDGMPWLPCIFAALNALDEDWRWVIAEGASMNGGSTRWCSPQEPRLSNDGTTQFLDSIAKHQKVTVLRNESWPSKDDQVNACLAQITDDCVLMQMDADEVWQPASIRKVLNIFETNPHIMRAYFKCRYFVGVDRFIGFGAEDGNSWLRAWRFTAGMRFDKHEPPILAGNAGALIGPEQTFDRGISFDHYAYATRRQVAYKEEFYGARYAGAVGQWERLQAHTRFPVRLRHFFRWANAHSVVVKS